MNGHDLIIQEGGTITGTTGNPARYPQIDVWSGFSSGAGGSITSKGILNAYIDVSSTDVSISIEGGSVENIMLYDGSISVTDGTVNHLQTWGTAEVTISGTPVIGALGFDVDTNNEGIWGSLTITGGYFGNNPYEIVNAREDIKAHIETDIPEPEAYTNQADWAVDHTVY
ncbi:MAG: hypothetical protein K6B44_03260 [Lachnospiraceae bacterium]|nr:hypothetical protein [Lachnospiraceae bacterium]